LIKLVEVSIKKVDMSIGKVDVLKLVTCFSITFYKVVFIESSKTKEKNQGETKEKSIIIIRKYICYLSNNGIARCIGSD